MVGLLQATEGYVWGRDNGRPISFGLIFLLEGAVWLGYAGGAPGVAAWGLRFRIEWPPRAPAVIANVVAAAAVVTVFALAGPALETWFGPVGARPPYWAHVRAS